VREQTVEFRNGAETIPPPGPQPEQDSGGQPTAEKTEKEGVAAAGGWPKPPAPIAFHGLAGNFVRVVEPHSEADPAALLVEALLGFGNVVGRGAHFTVESDRHSTNLSAVIVGATSKGRKGTSWGRVRAILSQCDAAWASSRILGGLSSGEGLIWAVRDPITKHEAIRERGVPVRYQDVEADAGVADKRLLVVEPEFASVLRQLERDGNTLSATIRQVWDSGDLRTMTKTSPAVATGAHVSIIGHITESELRRYLGATEQGNGFANRFLWLCSRRSKFLPEDEDRQVCDEALAQLVTRFQRAVEFARTVGEVRRDEVARNYWRAIYRDLSEGKPGLLGAVTSRAEAQVMRLAMIYALLDCSAAIGGAHLEAAVALWEYVERSCAYIFADATGNPDSDVILKALRNAPAGLTRTEINGLFGRNKPAAAIARSLDELSSLGLARSEQRETGGRPAEVWVAI
jgi:hypothetical protein